MRSAAYYAASTAGFDLLRPAIAAMTSDQPFPGDGPQLFMATRLAAAVLYDDSAWHELEHRWVAAARHRGALAVMLTELVFVAYNRLGEGRFAAAEATMAEGGRCRRRRDTGHPQRLRVCGAGGPGLARTGSGGPPAGRRTPALLRRPGQRVGGPPGAGRARAWPEPLPGGVAPRTWTLRRPARADLRVRGEDDDRGGRQVRGTARPPPRPWRRSRPGCWPAVPTGARGC
jgi:hypothetical protein